MPNLPNPLLQMTEVTQRVRRRAARLMRGLRRGLRIRTALAAEQLFLKHQGALYQARHAHSRRHQHVHRLLLVWLSYWFNWQPALNIVQPKTFKRWRRQRWRLLWKTPSRFGTPSCATTRQVSSGVTSRRSSAEDGQSYRRGSSSSFGAGRTELRQGNGGERRRAQLPRCSSDVRPGRDTWKTQCSPRHNFRYICGWLSRPSPRANSLPSIALGRPG
jgi:hypothetical protein